MDKNRIIRIILLLIIILCFGSFAVSCILNAFSENEAHALSDMTDNESLMDVDVSYQTDPAAKHKTKEERILKKYRALYQKNKNLIGWIKIDDTNIDYPVVKSINGKGEFYLDHNYDGKEDRNGTLFMDDACDPLRPSTNLIIYGHNMRSGQMFGSLSAYKSESFYKTHKTIKFDTIFSEGIYEVLYAFQSRVYAETEITFKYYQFIDPASEAEFNSGIREMENIALYKTDSNALYGDELLTLSTCDYDEANGRFVVVCKKVNNK